MKKQHNVWAIVVLLGLLGWGIFDAEILNRQEPTASSGEQGNGQIGIEKGNTAPDFELQQIGGDTVKLSDLRGKKVILNLWATWCPPCRAEMPDMQRYYEENKEKGVVILGVNLTDTESSPEAVADFVKLYGITFPILLDPDKEVANVYKAISIPTTYIIDSNGVVQNKYIGPMSEEVMENMLSAIK
ncbi:MULTISPECIES: peroxiredoxin [Brevibacillus]|uniref:peroxiredoxin family protein n=1 Tax=Brevibacillus TaxID=55080 RepID=UPI000D0E3ABE|nr:MULTISPECIES: TlpA disulfide reductase family protein [Brevibacillus]MED1948064.1 TlpA disulfide reductase family protein [Brevibacillus formosus]MED1998205.1 TlpA disulfide reductase family protein [Brevibacillus formosus]MED2080746.1 TlpA disulfide reductase family protein [Brevibacillus formosus]PSK20585.1 cytochrome C biogenesis protein [Brevibacillus sp. NRRL NRS-603]